MTSSPTRRPRLLAAAALLATVAAVTAAVLTLTTAGAGVPSGWWPHTGHAFTPRPAGHHPRPRGQDERCGPIVGPAKAYCRRGTAQPVTRDSRWRQAWPVLPVAAAAGALAVRRRRPAKGGGR
ncbi:hypothetical protein [Streptomyces sp. NPDC086766]|uniref:hypothetical protein n=1 Tax=Streptomyces sp. NPDC086766 TaxID=3365754 RepID=UPI0037F70D4C